MSDRRSPVTPTGAPRIGDLIDLERALEEDRDQPIEVLLGRDARIGREIDALHLDDRTVLFAWLERVRGGESVGQAVEALLRLVAVVLVVAGLVTGALGVAGWLWSGGDAPINVVQLWPTLIGVQLALAMVWVVVRLTSRRIQGVVAVGLSTWLPSAFGALAARFAKPEWRDAWHRFRALDSIYGGLAFWRVTQLTQSFAVAFNLAALVALFFIPTVDDPAFGWRSRLMDAAELQAVTEVIAMPWAAVFPEAVPTRAEIEATEGSSLEPGRAAGKSGRSEVWAAWWPFLVASFVVYGLLPRVLIQSFAGLRVRRLLAGVAFDHANCVRLRERLRRPEVDARAEAADGTSVRDASDEVVSVPLRLPPRVRALRWAGVPLFKDADALATRLARVHGVVVDRVETVGGLDLAADERALEAMRDAPAVLAVVEAWEAPGADHVDLLRRLRGVLRDRAPLIVLACEIGVEGRAVAVEPQHLSLWRRRLATLADPWLRVEPYPAEAAG